MQKKIYFISCTIHECIEKSKYKRKHAIRDADFGDILYKISNTKENRIGNGIRTIPWC